MDSAMARATVNDGNELLARHGPMHVCARLTNRARKKSGVAHGAVTNFFPHTPNKKFKVGITILFNGVEHVTPSNAGDAMTQAVRARIGVDGKGGGFDGCNRLWLMYKSDVYGPEHAGRWLKVRFGEFLTREMRKADTAFQMPPIDQAKDASDLHMILSSSQDSSVAIIDETMTMSKRGGGGRKREPQPDDDAASSKTPEKRLRMIPRRLESLISALYLLYSVDSVKEVSERLAGQEESEWRTLQSLLALEHAEVKELIDTAHSIVVLKKGGSA